LRYSRRVKSHLLIALLAFSAEGARAITIEPKDLTFETRLDEPVLLSIAVDLEGGSSEGFTADVEGFRCDRRVTPLRGGRYRIDIAPDTLAAGMVNGNVILLRDDRPIAEPVSVSGTVKPWIRIQPARLFLASVGHGAQFETPQAHTITLVSDNEPFDIESVGFPGIEDAAWECEPAAGEPSNTKKLRVTFSPNALAAGFPFGALATKHILVNTTHPRASRLVIPAMGMLSVNTTGRDYSQFLYSGNVRWEGWWATPNIAAAFLATATVLLCGIGAAIDNVMQRWRARAGSTPLCNPRFLVACRCLLAIVIFAAMAAGCWFLAGTYSRGGWLAMAAGIAILLAGIRRARETRQSRETRKASEALSFLSRPFAYLAGTLRKRLYPMALAVLFAASIAAHPAGLDRATSTAAVAEDRSISNRMLVWRGALQMMAEHPWTGVGVGKFGDAFKKDYQLPTHTQDYSTAINSFLTLGAERGIPILAATVAAFMTVALAGFRMGARQGSAFPVGCAAAIVTYLVCAWFSSIIPPPMSRRDPSVLLLAAVAGIALGAAWNAAYGAANSGRCLSQSRAARDEKGERAFQPVPTDRNVRSLLEILRSATLLLLKRLSLGLVCAAALGAVVGAIVYVAGHAALRSHPSATPIDIAGVSGLEVTSRARSPKGLILYIADRDETADNLLKSTLRPLAREGWRVLCFNLSPFASDARRELLDIIGHLQQQGELSGGYCVAGHRQGAQLAAAVAVAAQIAPSQVACYLTSAASAFDDLCPTRTIPATDSPILLAAQDADPLRSAQHLLDIAARIRPSGPDAFIRTHEGAFAPSSPRWQEWIREIDAVVVRPANH
jgi:O-antigen ligase